MSAHVRPCVRYRESVLILQVNPFIHIVTEKFQADIWTMNMFVTGSKNILKLEALRECRPPWLRQIITPILSTVKMLSLGCERLSREDYPPRLKKKKKKKKKNGSGSLPSPRSGYATTITVFFCSFNSSYNTQITTKI